MRSATRWRRSVALRACAPLLLALGAACAAAESLEATQRIIDYLAMGDYGRASALYRRQEELVLSADAAPAWRRGLEHQNASVREWSIDALSRIAGDGDFERLVAALDDPSRGVRHQARDGIIRMDTGRAAGVFRGRLGSSEPDQVVLAAQGAAELRDVAAVPEIIQRLEDESLPAATRGTLAQPLSVIGDPSALAPLVVLAENGGADLQLRRLAAEGAVALAGQLRDAQAVAAVEALAGNDDDYIRALAGTALEELR
jgi:HEAT repeat protein